MPFVALSILRGMRLGHVRAAREQHEFSFAAMRTAAARVGAIAGVFLTVTALIVLGRTEAPVVMLAMLYVFVIVPVAALWGFGLGIAVALASFLTCTYFFLPPEHSVDPKNPLHVVTLLFNVCAAALGAALGRASRQRQEMLAVDRAALRRLVADASGATPPAAFAAIAEETGRVVGARIADIVRFEPDGTVTIIGRWTAEELASLAARPVGQRLPLDGQSTEAIVLRTARAARIESFDDLQGPIAAASRLAGIQSEIGAPIHGEDDRIWGAIIVATTDPLAFPRWTEARLENFAEIATGAVLQAEARAALRETRARLVESADDARRRIERTLHDGVQHQLIVLGLRLNSVLSSIPPELADVRTSIERAATGLDTVVSELRTISHGLNPPVLAREGLEPALKCLLRSFPFPIELRLTLSARQPGLVEETAYYVISEALANVAKHARASFVMVEVDDCSDVLRVVIDDDGCGGAVRARGAGLTGIEDRVAAAGGRLSLVSPRRCGTRVTVELPLDRHAASANQA